MSAQTTEAPRARRPRQPQPPAWTRHTADDLTFAGRDGDLHHFTAASASEPGRVNTVTYDATARAAECDCKHEPCEKADGTMTICWHRVWAERAFLNALARAVAAGLSDEELVVAGKQAAARVEQADKFWAAFSAIDRPMLDACRAEWTRRERARRGTAPAPAPVADLALLREQKRRALADLYGDDLPPAA